MSEKLIKGIPRKEYMRKYMREYSKRPEIKEKKSKKKMIEDVLDKAIENQKKTVKIKKAEILSISRMDSKNRITLDRRTCNHLGVNSGDEIAFIAEGKHIQIVRLEDIDIYYT